jgi:hypothetical protein
MTAMFFFPFKDNFGDAVSYAVVAINRNGSRPEVRDDFCNIYAQAA